jgi:(p)ppGpp synthase/HD superfamily hydrolase
LDDIEIDVRDCYPSLLGGILHSIAEDNAMPGDVVEKRYGKTFRVPVDGITQTTLSRMRMMLSRLK